MARWKMLLVVAVVGLLGSPLLASGAAEGGGKAPFVKKEGDTMTGDLGMGANAIVFDGRRLAASTSGVLGFDGFLLCVEGSDLCAGATGPAGPAGPAGPQGPTGATPTVDCGPSSFVQSIAADGSAACDAIGAGEILSFHLAGAYDASSLEVVAGAVTSEKIADGTIGARDIAPGAIGGAQIADGSIGAAHIATGAVGSDEILDNTITGDDIADNSITGFEIAWDAVTTAHILAGTITDDDIADNSLTEMSLASDAVGASELADDAVDTGALQDGAVTASKMRSNAMMSLNGGPLSLVTGANVVASGPLTVPAGGTHNVLLTGQVQLGCDNSAATPCDGVESSLVSWQLYRDAVQIGPSYTGMVSATDAVAMVASIAFLDQVAAGSHTYALVVTVQGDDTVLTVTATNAVLTVADLGTL